MSVPKHLGETKGDLILLKTPRGGRKTEFPGIIASRRVYEKSWREGMVFELESRRVEKRSKEWNFRLAAKHLQPVISSDDRLDSPLRLVTGFEPQMVLPSKESLRGYSTFDVARTFTCGQIMFSLFTVATVKTAVCVQLTKSAQQSKYAERTPCCVPSVERSRLQSAFERVGRCDRGARSVRRPIQRPFVA